MLQREGMSSQTNLWTVTCKFCLMELDLKLGFIQVSKEYSLEDLFQNVEAISLYNTLAIQFEL